MYFLCPAIQCESFDAPQRLAILEFLRVIVETEALHY